MKYLLGFNKQCEVVFGEFRVKSNGEFSASFSCVRPFVVESSDGVEYWNEILNDCYNDEQKYELCERYDCKPSELAEIMANEQNITTNADEMDCSLYANRIYVDGEEWAFESSSCGQCDILEDGDLLEYTNKEAIIKLYNYWEQYHLKTINDDIADDIIKTIEALEIDSIKEENIIASYICDYII